LFIFFWMEMEPFEKTLKSSFVGAANHITQLYTNSLNLQKQSYSHGYNQSTRETLEFLKHHNGRNIPTEELMEYLKNKLERNTIPFENHQKNEMENPFKNGGMPFAFEQRPPQEEQTIFHFTANSTAAPPLQPTELKKRQFEIPTNSMDYCYPEQFCKKSRVVG